MNKQLKKEKGAEALADYEKASVNNGQTTYLDEKLEETKLETGVYQVVMTVMEECMDSSIVYTKVVKGADGKDKCELVKITAGLFSRDCG